MDNLFVFFRDMKPKFKQSIRLHFLMDKLLPLIPLPSVRPLNMKKTQVCCKSLEEIFEKIQLMHQDNLQVYVLSSQAIKIVKQFDVSANHNVVFLHYFKNFNKYLLFAERNIDADIYYKADICKFSIEQRSQLLDEATCTLRKVLFYGDDNQTPAVHEIPCLSVRKKIYDLTKESKIWLSQYKLDPNLIYYEDSGEREMLDGSHLLEQKYAKINNEATTAYFGPLFKGLPYGYGVKIYDRTTAGNRHRFIDFE